MDQHNIHLICYLISAVRVTTDRTEHVCQNNSTVRTKMCCEWRYG